MRLHKLTQKSFELKEDIVVVPISTVFSETVEDVKLVNPTD